MKKFRGHNLTNCFEKMANFTQDKLVLHIVKFGLTMEFAEVPVCQFVPPLSYCPAETEIIDAEICKVLCKDVIINTTRQSNNVSKIFTRTKTDGN